MEERAKRKGPKVYDRARDPNTKAYLDEMSHHSSQGSFAFEDKYKELKQGAFIGLPQNESEVTKLLISKKDYYGEML